MISQRVHNANARNVAKKQVTKHCNEPKNGT
jgi:hypothetical protein